MTQPQPQQPQLARVPSRRGYAPTLGWYLARRWLVATGLTLFALLGFFALTTVLEAVRSLADSPHAGIAGAMMSLLQLPDLTLQILPFAILLGTLVWLQQLQATQELTAMRASGLPLRRLMVPALLSCAAVGVGAVIMLNPVAATFMTRYETWQDSLGGNMARGVLTPSGSLWLRQDLVANQSMVAQTVFLYGGTVTAQGTQLKPATMFVFNASNALVGRFDAAVATLQPQQWRLQDVNVLRPNQPMTTEASLVLPTTLTPGQLAASLNPPQTLNVWQLSALLGVLKANGWQAGPYQVALASVVVLPLFCLALLILAVPFGLQKTRTNGMLLRLALGFMVGFGFFLLRNWANAFALAGRLDPWLAALVPVVVGLVVGLFMLAWLREE